MYSNYIQILFWLQANHVKKHLQSYCEKNNIKSVDGHSWDYSLILRKRKKFL